VDARLLNRQKQEVFDVLRKGRLDPLQFGWTTQHKQSPPRLVSIIRSGSHPEFSFVFDFHGANYFPYCSPWTHTRHANFGSTPWPSILSHVHTWGQLVQAELNTPDPWTALPGLATTTDIAVASNVRNTEFSHRETERLNEGLEQIRSLLLHATRQSTEKAALINEQLNSLLDASKRMGRKDWVNQAIGALITLSITIALPPEITKQALEILRQTLTGLVHLMPQIVATGQQLM
jgi:hypothetical protein